MTFDGAVFLDCGSHIGQTLEEVVKQTYGFKTIFGFEPMPTQFNYLVETYKDNRVYLCNYGLADRTETMNIYGSNSICEASLYPNKRDVDQNIVTQCLIVEASEFFREHISSDDRNVMKFNCEGAEVPILNNLMDTGEIWKVSNMVITFDCRYISGEEHHEAELINRLHSINYDRWVSSDDAFVPHTQPHSEKIEQWLSTIA
jgi:FkbM family methyltransferase